MNWAAPAVGTGPGAEGFEHEAFLYQGAADFLQGTVPFIQAGLDAAEPVLVVVDAAKITELRSALGTDAGRITFRDMAEVGRNPARIIPAWREFADRTGAGRPFRGIGEPVWAARSADELAECQRHEALLNVAFAGGVPWKLLCPYDVGSLGPDVIGEARHSHRFLTDGRARQQSVDYLGDAWAGADDELPPAPDDAACLEFGPGSIGPVRRFVADHAGAALGADALGDLLLAVTEVAGNTIVHGGGHGVLRVWRTADRVVCEIRDRGWIQEPLAGRARPSLETVTGRGLWMVNQLCDLLQLRSGPAGTIIRLHTVRQGAGGAQPA